MQYQLTFEQKKNLKAVGVTIGAHLLLLFFFLYYKYAMPMAVVPEPMGLEVNLGTTENGFGTDQPEAMGAPSEQTTQQTTKSGFATSSKVVLKGIMTSNNQDAPAVTLSDKQSKTAARLLDNRIQKKQQQPINTNHSNTPKAAVQKPLYTYSGSQGSGQGNDATQNHPGGSEGIGNGNGDMGVPGGTPGAANYKGVPGGHGNIYASVGNRFLAEKPSPEAKYKEGGKVTIRVTVNREGIITDYSVVSAANSTIKDIALQKLKHVKFNKAPTARPEMFGTITFDFTTR